MGSLATHPSGPRLCSCANYRAAAFLCMVFIIGTSFVEFDYIMKLWTGISTDFVATTQANSWHRESSLVNVINPTLKVNVINPTLKTDISDLPPQANSWHRESSLESTRSNSCKSPCTSLGSEALPKGIVSPKSDLEMVPLWGSRRGKDGVSLQKSLLAIPVGINQKAMVNQIVMKFVSSDFTVMLFHYDGVVDEWKDLQWSDSALHISAINQTKWWFAKRFLHPDIVAPYKYIFLWDEDIEVENFHPKRYLMIVEREGLEISQPALDLVKSRIHHQITARLSKRVVHRRMYKFSGDKKCDDNSSQPPCTGWVEMMAPVFSRAAWRCAWHMIQNDLIHAWGLDMKLGYCAQGDQSKNIGVVDSEYIVHKGLPTLGGFDEKMGSTGSPAAKDRSAVRRRSSVELEIFRKRWQKAVTEDNCWIDPYPEELETNSRKQ
uniref:Lysine ketoglutarate reductase trans-splicing related 1 n=1 Tax=Musa acuminata subsp. malaccensis TaxID=214687 RepID=A0A804L1H8_MUSAM|nr:PREDICTED: uncharacterized protein LOC103969504 isoform X1 [Musa acuminata subsp. malaccensis]XP_018675086.1 PREDICTED: uncharacterized protein LOC103969504 isoform X1 [Musa acuminata subsp. malaccensis]XP_018675087.1 PREDICTED: uncharacterized protein LOC103969504 isoform X1 [Musa acuminata subsp. malaccensis]